MKPPYQVIYYQIKSCGTHNPFFIMGRIVSEDKDHLWILAKGKRSGGQIQILRTSIVSQSLVKDLTSISFHYAPETMCDSAPKIISGLKIVECPYGFWLKSGAWNLYADKDGSSQIAMWLYAIVDGRIHKYDMRGVTSIYKKSYSPRHRQWLKWSRKTSPDL